MGYLVLVEEQGGLPGMSRRPYQGVLPGMSMADYEEELTDYACSAGGGNGMHAFPAAGGRKLHASPADEERGRYSYLTLEEMGWGVDWSCMWFDKHPRNIVLSV